MMNAFPEGNGIFETLKTTRGKPFALGRHIARAARSARKIGIPFPTENEIRVSVNELLQPNLDLPETGRLRMTFTDLGEFELLHENLHTWTAPARLTLLDLPVDENSPLSGIKSLPFTENVQTLEFARTSGFDDGIRLNMKGEVCESAVANLLLRIDEKWVTPNLASGCLPGITRELALEWCSIGEEAIFGDALDQVEAIFLLSSLKDLQPVALLGTRELEIDLALPAIINYRMLENVDP